MRQFKERERAFEGKFAHDQEMLFKITVRRNRLLGAWAAAQMKLTPEETESYAKSVVQADFEEAGDDDVVRKLMGDFAAADIALSEAEIRTALQDKEVEARRQLLGDL